MKTRAKVTIDRIVEIEDVIWCDGEMLEDGPLLDVIEAVRVPSGSYKLRCVYEYVSGTYHPPGAPAAWMDTDWDVECERAGLIDEEGNEHTIYGRDLLAALADFDADRVNDRVGGEAW